MHFKFMFFEIQNVDICFPRLMCSGVTHCSYVTLIFNILFNLYNLCLNLFKILLIYHLILDLIFCIEARFSSHLPLKQSYVNFHFSVQICSL